MVSLHIVHLANVLMLEITPCKITKMSACLLYISHSINSHSSSVQIMGTSASATSQAAPLAPTHQADHQGNSMAEHRRSLQSVNIRNSKAKSIITNKVAPVVIT